MDALAAIAGRFAGLLYMILAREVLDQGRFFWVLMCSQFSSLAISWLDNPCSRSSWILWSSFLCGLSRNCALHHSAHRQQRTQESLPGDIVVLQRKHS